MRPAIERITKIDKDDFRKIGIEPTQLIESLLKILLLDCSRYRIRRHDSRRRVNRDTLFRRFRKPVNHQRDDQNVEGDTDVWIFDGQPKQQTKDQIDERPATAATSAVASSTIRLTAANARKNIGREQDDRKQ